MSSLWRRGWEAAGEGGRDLNREGLQDHVQEPDFPCRKEGPSKDRSPGDSAGVCVWRGRGVGRVRTCHECGPAARPCWTLSCRSSAELLGNTVRGMVTIPM